MSVTDLYRCGTCRTALVVAQQPPTMPGLPVTLLVTPCKRCLEIARRNALDTAALARTHLENC